MVNLIAYPFQWLWSALHHSSTPLSPRRRSHAAGISLLLLTLLSSGLQAAPSAVLDVSVDRTRIGSSDTLTLSVTGEKKIEVNFSTLFNLNSLNLPAPDLGELENDWAILDSSQKYSIRSVNGDNRAQITWTYALAPKRTGTLRIPALTFEDSASEPIDVVVEPGSVGLQDSKLPSVFIEAEADKNEAYVGEQVIYTLRLYTSVALLSGELDAPAADGVLVEPLGEQKKYRRIRDERAFDVVERQYVVFPQAPGKLTVPGPTFNGSTRNPQTMQRQFSRATAPEVTLTVQAPPAQFTGKQWLPATSLMAEEHWSTDPDKLAAGDSVTRTITVRALGLLDSALPPIEIPTIDGVRTYADQPQLESTPNAGGVSSVRKESQALVALHPGPVTLPSIHIPWWDTVNNVQREAVIPGRTITVLPATTTGPAPAAPPSESPLPLPTLNTAPSSNTVMPPSAPTETPWQWLSGALAVGWLLSVLVLWRRRQAPAIKTVTEQGPDHEAAAFARVERAANQGTNALLAATIAWAQQRWPAAAIHSVADVVRITEDTTLAALARRIEAQRYHPAAAEKTTTLLSKQDGEQWLEKLQSHRRQQSDARKAVLPPFRPRSSSD